MVWLYTSPAQVFHEPKSMNDKQPTFMRRSLREFPTRESCLSTQRHQGERYAGRCPATTCWATDFLLPARVSISCSCLISSFVLAAVWKTFFVQLLFRVSSRS